MTIDILDLSKYFLTIRYWLNIFDKNSTYFYCVLPLNHIRRNMVSVCPITGDAKFDHLSKGWSLPYLSRVKISFSPLEINK